MKRIPYPIPELDRLILVAAGQSACAHHFPRTTRDRDGNPDFVADADYRVDHLVVEAAIERITAKYGVEDATDK